MAETHIGDEQRSHLVRRHFHEPFSPEGMNDLLSVVRHSRVSAGQALVRQGASEDDLFPVLTGNARTATVTALEQVDYAQLARGDFERLAAKHPDALNEFRAPSILGAVMRATEINSANRMRQPPFRDLADLLIEPPLGDYPILAFDSYQPIIDIGYQSARDAIAAWRSQSAASA